MPCLPACPRAQHSAIMLPTVWQRRCTHVTAGSVQCIIGWILMMRYNAVQCGAAVLMLHALLPVLLLQTPLCLAAPMDGVNPTTYIDGGLQVNVYAPFFLSLSPLPGPPLPPSPPFPPPPPPAEVKVVDWSDAHSAYSDVYPLRSSYTYTFTFFAPANAYGLPLRLAIRMGYQEAFNARNVDFTFAVNGEAVLSRTFTGMYAGSDRMTVFDLSSITRIIGPGAKIVVSVACPTEVRDLFLF